MKTLRRIRRLVIGLVAVAVLGGLFLLATNLIVRISSGDKMHEKIAEAKPAETAIILGALVEKSGRPSGMLAERIDAGYELYHAGKVKKILVSGDHGGKDYDEVNLMRRSLLERGVPAQDLFLDHAGFDTYDSLYRARSIFEVKSAIVVSQRFHLPRAVYIGDQLGLKVQGVVADRHHFNTRTNNLREVLAESKSFVEVLRDRDPKFGGPKIPINGDGRASWDEGVSTHTTTTKQKDS